MMAISRMASEREREREKKNRRHDLAGQPEEYHG
jgi:hypothetical protein